MTPVNDHQLHSDLRTCQRRLGTPDEAPGDFERAQEIAHEINNRRTAAWLAVDLAGFRAASSVEPRVAAPHQPTTLVPRTHTEPTAKASSNSTKSACLPRAIDPSS